MIPKQLQTEGINFVILEKEGKKPIQTNWQKKKLEYNDDELTKHLTSKGNYGVRGGGDKQLVIVDFDNKEVQEDAIKKLPETFTVKTGSGLLHLYYFSDKAESFKIFNEEMDTLADVQGEGKQVVGAGSTHPNGNKYEIVKDVEISFIPYAELKATIMAYDKKPKKEEKPKVEFKDKHIGDNFLDRIKSHVGISDVLDYLGVPTESNPTQCPFHGSKGGKCLGYQDEVAHCFHCDGSWNVFSLIMQEKKCDFKESLEILAEIGGLQTELEESKKEWATKNKPMKVFTDKSFQMEIFENTQPIFYDKGGNFWLWGDFKWTRVDDVDILNMITDSTGQDIINSKNRTEILNTLKQYGRKKIPEDIKPTWIQFKDKIIDIKSGEEFEATPKYFGTNSIPYSLHRKKFENTPTIDKIFEEWVGKEYVQTLYEIISYCLLPQYPLHRIFCLIGGGMNGKSKFLELLRKFVGMSNCCSTELDTLLNSRFEVTRLHRKLVCQLGETNFNEMSKTSMLKKLSGGDLIGFEYKNKDPLEDHNYAKIIIATNNLPSTTDKTVGFYRRWLIIDFPNQFSEKKDILASIPEEEYESLALKCTGILKDLLTKKEFYNEGSIQQRMEKYESKSNFLEQFLKEFTLEDYSGYITKASFYKKFSEWCKENRHREMSETSLGLQMKKLGIETGRKNFDWMNDGKGGSARTWLGIKLID